MQFHCRQGSGERRRSDGRTNAREVEERDEERGAYHRSRDQENGQGARSSRDRQSHEEWIRTGYKTIFDRAIERVQKILATHEPTPFSEAQQGAIDEILKEAEAYYGQKGML